MSSEIDRHGKISRTCPTCRHGFVPGRSDQRFCTRECQVTGLQKARTKDDERTKVHVMIPDTQSRDGVPNDHLPWIGRYIADTLNKPGIELTVVHIGDHWDMPSLSSYDRGKKKIEGRRYKRDIERGKYDFHLLHEPFAHVAAYRHFFMGNHEDRITRAAEDNAQLDGLISLDDINEFLSCLGWTVHDFLRPHTIDGVVYAHYFYNPMTGRPFTGENVKLRLKNLGHTFSQGHQQTLDEGVRFVNGRMQRALVAGACYQHDEEYKGPQGNAHWRGIIVKHQVEDGEYDLMEVSLDYLCRRYEGHRLRNHTPREIKP